MTGRPLPARPGGSIICRVLDEDLPTEHQGRANPGAATATTPRRVVTRLRGCAGGLILMMLTAGIAVLSTPTDAAAAGVCIDTPNYNTWGPEKVRGGVDSLIDQAMPNGAFGAAAPTDGTIDPRGDYINASLSTLPGNYKTVPEAINDTAHTDYEKLGTAGTLWSVDYGSKSEAASSCFPIPKIVGNFLANTIFNIDKVGARLVISTYQWQASGRVLAPLNDPLDTVVRSYWTGFVKLFVGLFIAIGVFAVTWQALVKKRVSLGIGSVLWMVVAVAGLLSFVVKPSGIASTMDKTVADVSNFAIGAGNGAVAKNDPHVAATYAAVRNTPNGPSRIAADMMWRVMVFQPWLAGQWGDATGAPIYMSTTPAAPNTPADYYNGTTDARYLQLYSQACVLDPKVAVCQQIDSQPNAVTLSTGKPQISTSLFGSLTGSGGITVAPAFDAAHRPYAAYWYRVQNWTCEGAAYCLVGDRKVDYSNGWPYRTVWSGDDPSPRMVASITSGVATIGLGATIGILSAANIAYDLVMYLLLFLGVFFLLLGIQPTWGRKIALGFVSQLLQNGLKRIFTGVIISLLVVLFGVFQASAFGWAARIGLMIGVGAAVLLLRRPMMDTIGVVKIGGGNHVMPGAEDSLHQKASQTGRRGVTRGRAGATVAGATAGVMATAPVRARRAVTGGRTAGDLAAQRNQQLAEAGTGLSQGQQRRTRTAATFKGVAAGWKAPNRFAAHTAAEKRAEPTITDRHAAYTRRNEQTGRTGSTPLGAENTIPAAENTPAARAANGRVPTPTRAPDDTIDADGIDASTIADNEIIDPILTEPEPLTPPTRGDLRLRHRWPSGGDRPISRRQLTRRGKERFDRWQAEQVMTTEHEADAAAVDSQLVDTSEKRVAHQPPAERAFTGRSARLTKPRSGPPLRASAPYTPPDPPTPAGRAADPDLELVGVGAAPSPRSLHADRPAGTPTKPTPAAAANGHTTDTQPGFAPAGTTPPGPAGGVVPDRPRRRTGGAAAPASSNPPPARPGPQPTAESDRSR